MKRPKTIICYICGKEYGSMSLPIHIKSCIKKWDIEQDQLDKKQRRPCPQAPPGFENVIRVAQGKKPIKELADPNAPVSFDAPISGGGNMTKEEVMQSYNNAAYENWDKNVLEPCPHCSRTFQPRSLQIHLKSCKAGKPLKPLGATKRAAEEAKVPASNQEATKASIGKFSDNMMAEHEKKIQEKNRAREEDKKKQALNKFKQEEEQKKQSNQQLKFEDYMTMQNQPQIPAKQPAAKKTIGARSLLKDTAKVLEEEKQAFSNMAKPGMRKPLASSKLEGSLKAVSGLKLPTRIGAGTKATTLKKPASAAGKQPGGASKANQALADFQF